MENAVEEKNRTRYVLVLIAAIMVVVLIAALAAGFLLDTPKRAGRSEETIVHDTSSTEEIWQEEELEEEDTSPASVLHLLPENPYGKFDFQYDGWFLKSTVVDCLSGIDVSAYQGDIDWNQVAESGVDFAIVRLGYRGYESGKLTEDKFARMNLDGATAAGIKLGVYFFSQALNVEEAQEEARFVLDMIQDYDITMPVVFDWEHVESAEARTGGFTDRELLTVCARSFCDVVSAAGYEPMVYFNVYQARDLYDLTALRDCGFWLAQYVDGLDYPHAVDLWQYTESGEVDGIRGRVDLDLWLPCVEK